MPYRYSFTGAGEMEYYQVEAAEKYWSEKALDNKLALLGPYRGIVPAIAEKPAAPDRKLARSLRRIARQKRRQARREAWNDFWAARRAKRLAEELKRKARAEVKAERLKFLEEEVLPLWLKSIEKYANTGEKSIHLDSGPHYRDLDKYDLLYMKDILRRYGFKSRLKERESGYHGTLRYLKVKW